MEKIKLQGISKSYAGKNVIDDISFTINEGEVCGLLGVNGAGKSTVMKCILDIVKKDKGAVIYNGQTIKESDLKDIGALIEMPAIYGNLTAYENLKAKALLYGVQDDVILEKLELVGLENTKKKAKKFSMGMKVRLGIAHALLTNPSFIILDEPTNGLDPQGINDLINLIKKLRDEGKTILLSSHRFKDITDVTNRVAIINSGKLAYDGVVEGEDELSKLFFDIVNKGA